MDALAGFLTGPRAVGAFLLRTQMDPPWALRIRDEAPLTILSVVRGSGCICFDDAAPHAIDAGDTAIVRGPDHYTVGDSPGTAPQAIIGPGESCTSVDGGDVSESMNRGVRTWGNSTSGTVVLLTGTYTGDGEVSRRLLHALPRLIVLRGENWDCPYVRLLAEEVGHAHPGQGAVLDRLLDLVLVTALRTWFTRPEARAPAWYRARTDPVAGPALRLLHNNPAHPWTVSSLAGQVGVARAMLARRFTELVGEPPMAFLTGWRLALAADLLLEPDATVQAVARRVGYGSPFTFSSAYKRRYGLSPQNHRAARLAG
ncbi:helix-turn-helix domain-containing protein [Pseudactinotalea sp. HY160]|uniref:AraC family transcriptional regulator n=1 Tax=Pseudactinotalea sp. HY160 TaxID=2654490 RepID=UPI00128B67F5|nr:AraC family transcriptional regulator [Pseudactinotalea sp. HY160]MPV51250.1 helix-turn-helix domain-containing protein [Pseudactinotalea sp. HY160]